MLEKLGIISWLTYGGIATKLIVSKHCARVVATSGVSELHRTSLVDVGGAFDTPAIRGSIGGAKFHGNVEPIH